MLAIEPEACLINSRAWHHCYRKEELWEKHCYEKRSSRSWVAVGKASGWASFLDILLVKCTEMTKAPSSPGGTPRTVLCAGWIWLSCRLWHCAHENLMISGLNRRSGVYVVFCTQLNVQKNNLNAQQKQMCVLPAWRHLAETMQMSPCTRSACLFPLHSPTVRWCPLFYQYKLNDAIPVLCFSLDQLRFFTPSRSTKYLKLRLSLPVRIAANKQQSIFQHASCVPANQRKRMEFPVPIHQKQT